MTPADLAAFQKRRKTPLDEDMLNALGPAPVKRKYGNVPTIVDGIKFDSKKEARVYQGLKLREKAGDIRNLNLKVVFPLRSNGVLIQRYECDFLYWQWDAEYHCWEIVVADVKSAATSKVRDWPRTTALFEACMGMPITELS